MTTEVGTDVQKARALLERGLLVSIPTETVYGLAANAYDRTAVVKIFEVKARPSFDPLIVHSNSVDRIREFVEEIPTWAEPLVERFWPGPLTLVLRKKSIIPDIVTSGFETVGVRIPRHPLTLDLLEGLTVPLAAPSANPFGYISPTTAQHVQDQLDGRISYILDGGACEVGVESTIVGEVEGVPTILRVGGVGFEAIRALVPDVVMKSGKATSTMMPGSLPSHYAPRTRLVIGSPDFGKYAPEEIGCLAFTAVNQKIPIAHQEVLSMKGDLTEAASRLFHAMRELDKLGLRVIYAERVPDLGIGLAINDRLERASFHAA